MKEDLKQDLVLDLDLDLTDKFIQEFKETQEELGLDFKVNLVKTPVIIHECEQLEIKSFKSKDTDIRTNIILVLNQMIEEKCKVLYVLEYDELKVLEDNLSINSAEEFDKEARVKEVLISTLRCAWA